MQNIPDPARLSKPAVLVNRLSYRSRGLTRPLWRWREMYSRSCQYRCLRFLDTFQSHGTFIPA